MGCGVCVSSLRGQFCKMYLSPGLILNCISFRQTSFTGRQKSVLETVTMSLSYLPLITFRSLY